MAFLAAALLACGAGVASQAAAQPAEDERVEAIRLMYGFATCAVRRHRYEAEQFTRLEPDSPESRAMGGRMLGSGCLETRDMSDGDGEVSLSFSWRLFRGGVFEALYRRDFRGEAPVAFDGAPALVMPQSSGKMPPGTRAWNMVRLGFGECVVRSAPAESRALILSEIAGPGEAAGFDALMPHFADCTAPGAESRYSRPALRGIVAEALYRLSTGAHAR